MKILGVETSCDETAAAIVEDGSNILSNIVASQVDIHARYGGIVPEVASRQHLITILPIVKQAMSAANMHFTELDAIQLLTGAEPVLLAGGGIFGAEGSAWIGISGTDEQVAAAMALVKSMAGEPACEV